MYVPYNLCVGVFNLDNTLSLIVKSSRTFVCSSSASVLCGTCLQWAPHLVPISGGWRVDTAVTRLHSTLGWGDNHGQALHIVIAHIYNIQLTGFLCQQRCFFASVQCKLGLGRQAAGMIDFQFQSKLWL